MLETNLDQLKKAIASAPEIFGMARKEEMLREAEGLSDADESAIEEKIIAFGKEIYPTRAAHLKLYRLYVKGGEEAAIRAELPEGLCAQFDKFLADLGDVEKVCAIDLRETDLTEEERGILCAAEVKVHLAAHKKCSELIRGNAERSLSHAQRGGEKKEEFEAALTEYQNELKTMEEKIVELRHLAEVNPEFSDEILDKAKNFELGLATDRGVIPSDIQEEIDFYSGIATDEAA
ncbi:MAG: hypothetical protein AAB731_02800 [Patescibacteria group bacterium]